MTKSANKRILIDLENGTVHLTGAGPETMYAMGTPEAFEVVSRAWLRAGWDNKYIYSFTWLGRPIIQLPEDMIRIQELIYSVRPDVIIETGIAHGGSLVYYASLCKVLERGRIVGIDVELRPHNRVAIEQHILKPYITLIDGSSIDPVTVAEVKGQVRAGENVLVVLDSCHSKDHVLAELRAYAPIVTPDSYIVAMDGIMGEMVGAPRTKPDWTWNNPREAALTFTQENPDFQIEEPEFPFNEGTVRQRVTYWPCAFIRRLK